MAAAIPVISALCEWVPEANNLAVRLKEAHVIVEDVVHELTKIAQKSEDNPTRLDALISRSETIRHLERKHGGDITHVLEYADAMRVELDTLENAEAHTTELEASLERAMKPRKKRQLNFIKSAPPLLKK